MTIYVHRGLPGSGKSTDILKWVSHDPENRVRVNRDLIREMLYGPGYYTTTPATKDTEDRVTRMEEAAVRDAVKGGKDVAIDATHLQSRSAKRWYDFSPDVVWVDHVVPVETAIFNCAKRTSAGGREVAESVVRAMVSRFHIKPDGTLPKPPVRSDHAPKFPPYVGNPDLPDVYIFDIDGTLSKMGDRSPYARDLYHLDTPHEHIVKLLQHLARRNEVVIVTGRMGTEIARAQTLKWLENIGVLHLVENVFMRADGDERNDAIIKAEIVHRDIAPYWNIQMAFDDRDRVVAAWRAMGIPCAQVAPGDF